MGLRIILWTQKPHTDGRCDIKIYLSRKGAFTRYSIGLAVYPHDFNERIGRVKPSHPNEILFNERISEAFNKFEAIMLSQPGFTVEQIIHSYEGRSAKSLLDFVDMFIKECEAGIHKRSEGTIKNYKKGRSHLQNFNDRIMELDFHTINKDLYNKFLDYFRHTLKMQENSIGEQVKQLKLFINEAKERGITDITEHEKRYFKKPSEETDSIYLTMDEIDKIIDTSLPQHLEAERDRFIVSYYLLLRFSDSINIDQSNFIPQDGRIFYKAKHIKTGAIVMVPVKPLVIEILERNKYSFAADNSTSNFRLKEVCRLSGLTDKINVDDDIGEKYLFATTHTARRSGATNMYLAKIDLKIVMALGGWNTEQEFRKYIRLNKLEYAQLAAQNNFFD